VCWTATNNQRAPLLTSTGGHRQLQTHTLLYGSCRAHWQPHVAKNAEDHAAHASHLIAQHADRKCDTSKAACSAAVAQQAGHQPLLDGQVTQSEGEPCLPLTPADHTEDHAAHAVGSAGGLDSFAHKHTVLTRVLWVMRLMPLTTARHISSHAASHPVKVMCRNSWPDGPIHGPDKQTLQVYLRASLPCSTSYGRP
jgi:hypothetical protein